jgi:hypothetical protein
MRHGLVVAALLLILAAIVSCSDNSTPQADSTTMDETAASPTPASLTPSGTTKLVGSWHRAQTCKEMLAAFEKAGIAESHRDWLQGISTAASRGRLRATCAKGRMGRWSTTTSSRLLVIKGDVATFDVDLPESCADKCADAYAWGLVGLRLRAVGARRGAVTGSVSTRIAATDFSGAWPISPTVLAPGH